MTVYDIEFLDIDDNLIKLESGYLRHHDQQQLKSWDIELYGTNNDQLFNGIMNERRATKLKIATKDGKEFLGMALITNLSITPLGTNVKLQGTGKLEEIH